MDLAYHCPRCDARLNPNVRVVLVARRGAQTGLALMSSQLGDFQVICDRGFGAETAAGEVVEFLCPVCHGSLTSAAHEHFAELKVTSTGTTNGISTGLLRFSRKCDEHATFLFDGTTVREFGEEAGHFRREMTIEGEWGW